MTTPERTIGELVGMLHVFHDLCYRLQEAANDAHSENMSWDDARLEWARDIDVSAKEMRERLLALLRRGHVL
jgi:hypothetical protein